MSNRPFESEIQNPYQSVPVIEVASTERATFIRKTYLHLALALAAFAGIETAILSIPNILEIVGNMLTVSKYSWLVVLGAFMLVSWVAERWAMSSTSKGMQYAGLFLYVTAQAIIFVPLMAVAVFVADATVLPNALLITGFLFTGLTLVVFTTRKDFSFMGGILKIGGLLAMGFIVASIVFGFSLGLLFSFVMVAFAGGAILYSTSNVLHHYHTEQYVAAALSLFAAVALLLWYVLRILLAFGRD
ncbi:MAG: US12 family protein [Leptospiraceae bacterium]|nr:US12 family protein [Leptospiraceae bacterium]